MWRTHHAFSRHLRKFCLMRKKVLYLVSSSYINFIPTYIAYLVLNYFYYTFYHVKYTHKYKQHTILSTKIIYTSRCRTHTHSDNYIYRERRRQLDQLCVLRERKHLSIARICLTLYLTHWVLLLAHIIISQWLIAHIM